MYLSGSQFLHLWNEKIVLNKSKVTFCIWASIIFHCCDYALRLSPEGYMFYHLLFVTLPCCFQKLTATLFWKVSKVTVKTVTSALRVASCGPFRLKDADFTVFCFLIFFLEGLRRKGCKICKVLKMFNLDPQILHFLKKKSNNLFDELYTSNNNCQFPMEIHKLKFINI